MFIRVELKDDRLGDTTFWEGDSKDIKDIKYVVPCDMAWAVSVDGVGRKIGMWIVSEVKEMK